MTTGRINQFVHTKQNLAHPERLAGPAINGYMYIHMRFSGIVANSRILRHAANSIESWGTTTGLHQTLVDHYCTLHLHMNALPTQGRVHPNGIIGLKSRFPYLYRLSVGCAAPYAGSCCAHRYPSIPGGGITKQVRKIFSPPPRAAPPAPRGVKISVAGWPWPHPGRPLAGSTWLSQPPELMLKAHQAYIGHTGYHTQCIYRQYHGNSLL